MADYSKTTIPIIYCQLKPILYAEICDDKVSFNCLLKYLAFINIGFQIKSAKLIKPNIMNIK